MKTILGTLLALGLLSSSASAWYCPPGSGYGHGQSYGHNSYQRPSHGHMPKVFVKPTVEKGSVVPVEPAPAPLPEPVPQK